MKVKRYEINPEDSTITFNNVEVVIRKKDGIFTVSNEKFSAVCKEIIDSYVNNRDFNFSVLEVLK